MFDTPGRVEEAILGCFEQPMQGSTGQLPSESTLFEEGESCRSKPQKAVASVEQGGEPDCAQEPKGLRTVEQEGPEVIPIEGKGNLLLVSDWIPADVGEGGGVSALTKVLE